MEIMFWSICVARVWWGGGVDVVAGWWWTGERQHITIVRHWVRTFALLRRIFCLFSVSLCLGAHVHRTCSVRVCVLDSMVLCSVVSFVIHENIVRAMGANICLVR